MQVFIARTEEEYGKFLRASAKITARRQGWEGSLLPVNRQDGAAAYGRKGGAHGPRAVEEVRRVLTDEWWTTAKVADNTSMAYVTIAKALRELRDEGEVLQGFDIIKGHRVAKWRRA